MGIKVLIADDDAGMRLVIRKAIEKNSDFSIIAEAENGSAALRLFEEQRPDVVFLDVEMPQVTGVECAKKIADVEPKTVIVFATAHEEYMPEAFEVYAFDYLVKPFKMDRLYRTLERIKTARLAGMVQEGEVAGEISYAGAPGAGKPNLGKQEKVQGKPEKVQEKPEKVQEKPEKVQEKPGSQERMKFPGKLIIRNREGISLVDMEDILLIQREDRSTVIYTSRDRFTTSESLGELEEKLDPGLFFRSHKSYIIHLSSVSKIYPYGRWTYIVKLKGTEKDALLTHEKYEELEKLFA